VDRRRNLDCAATHRPWGKEIGFTGGEPTLLGERFIELVRAANSHLPRTALHILSNGRTFAKGTIARDLGGVCHHDLMMGIPIYADLAHIHDYIVQADGAFDETIRGILSLKANGVRVEVRVVLQQQTVVRLVPLARFLARNRSSLTTSPLWASNSPALPELTWKKYGSILPIIRKISSRQ
jgi:MoaA/NifB/PqqE/SkfB family radical SAM enzyme